MKDSTKLKLLGRGSIVLGIVFILAALNFFPWEIFFHKYGASGVAYEHFVEGRADAGRENLPVETEPLDDELPDAVKTELQQMRLSEDNLRHLSIARNLIHRDASHMVQGLVVLLGQTLIWGVAFILGCKLIAFGRNPLKQLTEDEKIQSKINGLTARLEQLESRLDL